MFSETCEQVYGPVWTNKGTNQIFFQMISKANGKLSRPTKMITESPESDTCSYFWWWSTACPAVMLVAIGIDAEAVVSLIDQSIQWMVDIFHRVFLLLHHNLQRHLF